MADIIETVTTTPVLAPLPRPLLNASGVIVDFPLVLIEVRTRDGVTGRAYADVYFPELLPAMNATIQGLGKMIQGQALAPRDIHSLLLRRLRLLGTKAIVGSALGGLDMALWDAFARAHNEPLVRTLGAVPRPLRAYYSVGLYRVDEVDALMD